MKRKVVSEFDVKDYTLVNAMILLKKCVINGEISKDKLHSWFLSERQVIKAVINDIKIEVKN